MAANRRPGAWTVGGVPGEWWWAGMSLAFFRHDSEPDKSWLTPTTAKMEIRDQKSEINGIQIGPRWRLDLSIEGVTREVVIGKLRELAEGVS